MPTRRSQRLRATAADAARSTTITTLDADADGRSESTPALTAVEVATAATSRRARRMLLAGSPAAQPLSTPPVVIAQPDAVAAEQIAVIADSIPVIAEPVAVSQPDAGEQPAAAPLVTAESAADAGVAETASPEDRDAFALASEAFGFAPEADAERVIAASASDSPIAVTPAREHVAARGSRRRMRRVAAAGASIGVMGVAGLIAVSMSLPTGAVAASRGSGSAPTSLVASGGSAAVKPGADEVQAFVASADVQDGQLQRSESYSTISLAEVAQEEGIKFSESLYSNDPDAAIQWPFKVGVAMSSPYGQRWGRLHAGIDLVPGEGAPIQAIADGVVRTATESGGAYGVTIYIDHVIDGRVITSHYAHMQHGSMQVEAGDEVKVGDVIGHVGNTGRSYGAHLHFELIVNGSTIDPLPWMRENAGRSDY